MKKWTVIKRTTLFQNPFVTVHCDELELPSGFFIDAFCHMRFPDWVNVFAMTKDRQVLLVNQYRHGLGDFSLEVPAGMVEPGEDYADAIRRELLEETGYASEHPPILLRSMLTNPAITDNYVHSYLMLDCEKVAEPQFDETEDIELVTVDLDQFEQSIEEGRILQHFTITAYYLAKHYLEKQNRD